MTPFHDALPAAAEAARRAFADAQVSYSRAELREERAMGADGTPSMYVDLLVEAAIVDALEPFGLNVLSEECGFVDRGSALTVVVDPVDGSANAAAGVPISCFSAALADDGEFVQALTVWLDTGRGWSAMRDAPSALRTTGCTTVCEAAVSLLRPHERNRDAWLSVAGRATRVRVLGCSTFDAALVADGSIDAFVDAGSDTHRLVDLAAAVVLAEAAGGCVVDVFDRPIALDVDLHRRWSGVVAATPALAAELCALVAG